MPSKQPAEVLAKQPQDLEQLNPVIGTNVMIALGQPAELFKVNVRRLWEDHYRVNVFVGADAASVTVAHSYFVVGDSAGGIIDSTPKITRQYATARPV